MFYLIVFRSNDVHYQAIVHVAEVAVRKHVYNFNIIILSHLRLRQLWFRRPSPILFLHWTFICFFKFFKLFYKFFPSHLLGRIIQYRLHFLTRKIAVAKVLRYSEFIFGPFLGVIKWIFNVTLWKLFIFLLTFIFFSLRG